MSLFRPFPGYASNVVSAAANTAVALSVIKSHLNVEAGFTDDDTLITAYLEAGEAHIQSVTNRQLITQTMVYYWDRPPGARWLILPDGACQSVTHVKYRDENEAEQTLSSGDYTVDITDDLGGRIVLNENVSWPTVSPLGAALWVQAVVGYGDDPDDVPAVVRAAIMRHVSDAYEHRGDNILGRSVHKMQRLEKIVGKYIIPVLP